MPKLPNNTPVKKLLFCCNIDAETVLLLLSFVILYMALIELFFWWPFACPGTAVTYGTLVFAHYLAGFLLMFGVLCCSRGLVKAFAWVLGISLVASVAFIIAFYLFQNCLCEKYRCLHVNKAFVYLIYLKYIYSGIITGIHFVICLYILLLIIDYLAECCDPECEDEMDC